VNNFINKPKKQKQNMKTNIFTPKRITILFSLTVLSFSPFMSRAQLYVNSANSVGIGISTPASKLNISTAATNDGARVTQTGNTGSSLYLTQAYSDGLGHNWALFSAGSGNGTGNIGNLRIYDMTAGSERLNIVGATGNVGIGGILPATFKLNVNGTTQCTGNAWTSDQIFKTNVAFLDNALTTIHQLKPKSYDFDTANIYGFNFPSQHQYGFIAQEVEEILPDLVTTSDKLADYDTAGNLVHSAVTYKSLNYIAFISILTKGIQELDQKNNSLETKTNTQDSSIASLQNQVNQLLTTINNCCTINEGRSMQTPSNSQQQSPTKQTDVVLNDSQSVILMQNEPNPFSEQTTINYSLPDNTVKAQMLFYNAEGKLIQSTELTQKGKGTLNVFASDLSSGIYTYTLVVDGKIIETKKMVRQ
jgi:hypothetical protein